MSYARISIAVEDKPTVDVQELFKSTKPIYGESFTYPQGKWEMRLYKVDYQQRYKKKTDQDLTYGDIQAIPKYQTFHSLLWC